MNPLIMMTIKEQLAHADMLREIKRMVQELVERRSKQ